jgi:hypothetical protein
MFKRHRPRLTYANVLSTLALFVALGGGAYAASQLPANSVGTQQLKDNAVTSRKVKDHTLVRKDVAGGQFATPQQLAGKLGKNATAVNSAKLGGIAPAGFLQGTGHALVANYDRTTGGTVISVPGGGHVSILCDSSGFGFSFETDDSVYEDYQSTVRVAATPAITRRTIGPNTIQLVAIDKASAEAHFDVSSPGGSASLTVFGVFDDSTDHCIGRARGLAVP